MKIIFLVAFLFILSACTARNVYDVENETAVIISQEEPQMPVATPIPTPAPMPARYSFAPRTRPTPRPTIGEITWQPPSRPLVTVAGVITHVSGMPTNNTDWFEIEIEKPDGTPAIIAGMNSTGFFFGENPTHGMEIVAYIPHDAPTFINTPPLYVATAIVGGFTQYGNIKILHDITEPFTFITTNETEFFCEEFNYEWDMGWGFRDMPIVIMYNETRGEMPVARKVFRLNNGIPRPSWNAGTDDDFPTEITLTFRDYIFPFEDFEILDIPILLHGTEIETPPISAPCGTILVPLREAMTVGVGIYFATITHEGNLWLLSGGGGSEDSTWQVGREFFSSGPMLSRVPLLMPPILVGGIIYVPAIGSVDNAPFISGWTFPNRIEFYRQHDYPYGRWLGEVSWSDHLMTDEELASMPIVVNGVEISARAKFCDRNEWRNTILVPVIPILEEVGYTFVREEENRHILFVNPDGEEVLIWLNEYHTLQWLGFDTGISGIIYDGQILIKYTPVRAFTPR